MNPAMRIGAISLSLAVLSACTSLQPAYERPALPVTNRWIGQEMAVGGDAAVDLPWKSFVADPTLRRLIQDALGDNRDLRIAVLDIDKARAMYDIRRADLLPDINAGASESAQRTPAPVSSTGSTLVTHALSANVAVSAYELDLFGRVRSLRDQALQQYLATEEARRSTHLALVGAVISTYLQWTADTQGLNLAEDTLRSRQTAFDLQGRRLKAGSAAELSLRQADGELEAARAQVLTAAATVAMGRNALELLVGHPLPPDLTSAASVDEVLAVQDVPVGLPSDLLLNRPDILAAEHRLIGTNANIGAARAAFFPKVTLTGSAGFESDGLSSLFEGPNRAWSFLPQISLPIFDGGRRKANLAVAETERDIAVADYERSIQNAFREVADILVQRSSLVGQLQVAERRVAVARQVHDMVQRRFKVGVATYLEVLEAQRTLLATQQNLISVRSAQQIAQVSLYKALGGGGLEREEGVATAAVSDTPGKEK
ncbi:Outer membrane protein OprM [Serratia plymuthica]|uniref:efflux transporter outer membrane subunit n=1 Tax=Serratia plymuthica TaxID=82996 RepID=UPI0003491912|nr:efflux transporter outer membrane subunit [Serratia plymuthica]QJW56429.1 Outer membrane protein OprM [Serratia plymuthica]